MNSKLEKNLLSVKERICKACEKTGRSINDITLVAVSKNTDIDSVSEAISLGQRDFGENRTKEFLHKFESLSKDARFHFIGHLQTNKVKEVVGRAILIHSVDSIRLLDEINKVAHKKNIIQNVLIQADISKEETKFGADRQEIFNMIEENENSANVIIKGLMTMAPYSDNPEEIRWVFRELYNLYVDIKSKTFYNTHMEYISMGMSNDFEVAIEEGSNMVRIGSSIFG